MLTFRFSGADGCMAEPETLTSGMVGKEVKLELSGAWEGLTKTVVFTAGAVTRDVVDVSEVVVIPAEVLACPLQRLYVGIYGVSADGAVTPTIRAEGPWILPGADPSGDEGTDPDLPVWAQLQTQIADLQLSPGHYYTPQVSQPGENLMEFAWKASHSQMDPIPPVEVILPGGMDDDAQERLETVESACYVAVESTVGTIGDGDTYISAEADGGAVLNPVTFISQTDTGVSEVSLWHGGRNLFCTPEGKSELHRDFYVSECTGDGLSVTVTASNAAWFLTNPMLRCVPGDTFYYSWTIADYDGTQNPMQPLLALYDAQGQQLTSGVNTDYIGSYQAFLTAGTSFKITNSAAAYVRFGFRAKVGSSDFPVGSTVKMTNIMVTRNVSGLAFEAYAGQVHTAAFDRAVCGGTYEWSIGKLTITHDQNGEMEQPEIVNVKKYNIRAVAGTNLLCSAEGNTALAAYTTIVDNLPVNTVVENLLERVDVMEEATDTSGSADTAAAIGWTTPEMYGAVGDGVTDDSDAIQAAIDAAPAFSMLMFQNKTYCVSKPIALNKKVSIDGQGAVVKATQGMECVLRLTNQAAVRPYTIKRLTADANDLATDGFKIGGDIDATQITFQECAARNALRHGFYLVPLAYIVNFVECLASGNGENGINAVATGSVGQMNAVRIEKCSLVSNAASGVATQGVSISISECDFEFNNRGVTLGGVADYNTLGVWIDNCHMEGNTDAHIYIGETDWCVASVEHCYLNWRSDEGVDKAYVKVAETGGSVILKVDSVFFGDETPACFVDGGGRLERTSVIRCGNSARLTNMRFAHIEAIDTGERFLPLPATDSELAGPNGACTLYVPYDLTNALMRSVGAYMETDSTGAVLRCCVETYGPDGTNAGVSSYIDKEITESGEYNFNVLDNISARIPDRVFVKVTFSLVDADEAVKLTVKNPYLTCYR